MHWSDLRSPRCDTIFGMDSWVRKNAAPLVGILFALLVSAIPVVSYAVGTAADAMCVASQCTTTATPGHPLCSATPCVDATSGFTTSGFCATPTQCKASSAPGLSGGNALSTLSQLGQLLNTVLGKLLQPSTSASSPTTGASPTGCLSSYYYTSNTSLIGVDPCALYQPATTCTDQNASNFGASGACTYGTGGNTSSTSAQDLLNALAGGSGSTSLGGSTLSATPTSGSAPLSVAFSSGAIAMESYTIDFGDSTTPASPAPNNCSGSSSATCTYQTTHTYASAGTYTAALEDQNGLSVATVSISVTNPGGNTSGLSQVLGDVSNFLSGTTSAPAAPSGQTSPAFPGVFGNILLDQNGATIFASTINAANNSETSGFYGGSTVSGTGGFATTLCQNRPWASNFLENIIPATFFDSLCQWGGYQVGQPAQPQVTLVQTQSAAPVSKPVTTTTAATSTPTVPAQAQIWAVPSAVPLGARTSVFWNTQNAVSCTESSPDGNFSQNSLSGVASTVPLTGATTFTISCLDQGGNPITDFVTVQISS